MATTATATNNGSAKVTNTILAGLLVAIVLAVGGFTFSRSQEIEKCLREHEQTSGHPAVVERVNAIKADLAEIKKDLKELLKRNP